MMIENLGCHIIVQYICVSGFKYQILVCVVHEYIMMWYIMFQAMDLGVPVIARGIAGNKALITDKENGLLFSDKMVRWLIDVLWAITKLMNVLWPNIKLMDVLRSIKNSEITEFIYYAIFDALVIKKKYSRLSLL